MSILLAVLLLFQTGLEEHRFQVRHDHAFGGCQGELIFSDAGVRFEARDGEHSQSWDYSDVQFFEFVSEHEIRLHTYESEGVIRLWGDRDLLFTLETGAVGRMTYQFVRERSPRPVRANQIFADGTGEPDVAPLLQELPVRHTHFLGGCEGILRIWPDRITFETEHDPDSRIWLLDDLESFASTDDFDLRISTRNETFHFDLKRPLDRTSYNRIWEVVYAPGVHSYRGGVR
jgi:hypothetical protein